MAKNEYDLTPYQNCIDDIISTYHIKVRHINVEQSDPSVSFPNKNLIVINDNYQTNVSSLFILAHELYHAIYGANSQGIYAFSPIVKSDEEKQAHLYALKIFFESIDDEYIPNYVLVMCALGLPLSMEHFARQVWSERSSKFLIH